MIDAGASWNPTREQFGNSSRCVTATQRCRLNERPRPRPRLTVLSFLHGGRMDNGSGEAAAQPRNANSATELNMAANRDRPPGCFCSEAPCSRLHIQQAFWRVAGRKPISMFSFGGCLHLRSLRRGLFLVLLKLARRCGVT